MTSRVLLLGASTRLLETPCSVAAMILSKWVAMLRPSLANEARRDLGTHARQRRGAVAIVGTDQRH